MKIGFWNKKIIPYHNITTQWTERKLFIKQLIGVQTLIINGKIGKINRYKGFARCRICNCINGSTDYVLGKYKWPSGYLHYIDQHYLKPPEEFIKFINKIII